MASSNSSTSEEEEEVKDAYIRNEVRLTDRMVNMSQMPTQPKDFVSSKDNSQVIRDRAEPHGAKAEGPKQGGICMVSYI